jgi:hypothetical protein
MTPHRFSDFPHKYIDSSVCVYPECRQVVPLETRNLDLEQFKYKVEMKADQRTQDIVQGEYSSKKVLIQGKAFIEGQKSNGRVLA